VVGVGRLLPKLNWRWEITCTMLQGGSYYVFLKAEINIIHCSMLQALEPAYTSNIYVLILQLILCYSLRS